MTSGRLAILGVCCIAVAALAAQDRQPAGDEAPGEPQQPTFVAGTQFVRVDLYVTRDGRLVDDLRPDEVLLLEDDVPQTIDTFERIVYRPPDAFEQALDPQTLSASRALAGDPRSRVFVVFIDPRHTAYVSAEAPEAAAIVQRRFPVLRTLEGMLGPDDLVAVMTPEIRPEDLSFVRGLDGLARLEGEWSGAFSIIRPDPGRRLDPTEMQYEACYPPRREGSPAPEMIARRREQIALDALESLAQYLGALREERKGVLLVTDGWRIYRPNPGLVATGPGAAPTLPRPPIGGRGVDDNPIIVTERGLTEVRRADRLRCEADLATLASLDHSGRLQEIISGANRSNVSFYPASPAGLSDGTLAGASARIATYENVTPLERQAALRMLAEQTDGYAIVNTNNVSGGIERMVTDSSAYYLLGYESTNPALDGRFRRIRVQVNRPGVEVRARPGYVASPVPSRVPASSPVSPERDPIAAALSRVASTNDRSPLRLLETVWSHPDGAGFSVVGEIDASTRREPDWAQGATAEIVVQADGRDVLTTTAQLTAVRPSFAIRVPPDGRAAPGEYTVRVQVQGTGALARIGHTMHVTVPDETIPLGEPVVWRRGPSTGPQPVPTADLRFRRTERLRLELPVASDAPVTARLLDRTGALLPVPVTVSDRRDESGAFRWVVLDVTLAPLAPGDYVVEATQGETARVTAFRLVP